MWDAPLCCGAHWCFDDTHTQEFRASDELFLDTYLASAIIFGNVFTEQYLSWRRKTMQVS